jgi:hypothetical protein
MGQVDKEPLIEFDPLGFRFEMEAPVEPLLAGKHSGGKYLSLSLSDRRKFEMIRKMIAFHDEALNALEDLASDRMAPSRNSLMRPTSNL